MYFLTYSYFLDLLTSDGLMEEADGDYALSGVNITLIDAGRAVQSIATNGDGYYMFDNLLEGSYTVIVTPPSATWTQTFDPDALTDGQHNIVLERGEDYVLADFAFGPEPTAITTSSFNARAHNSQWLVWAFAALLFTSLWLSRSKVRGW